MGCFLHRLVGGVVLAAGLLLTGEARGEDIRLLEIDGGINPLTARYLERALTSAPTDGVALVVVRLDTPGGLDPSMRQMTRAILASPVPVAVYVAPAGARAASAGMFIALAAHVAAMAPGTNIGAAHPVSLGGVGGTDDATIDKAVHDAAALARALAQTRGRNVAWAESAVRESASVTAAEALERGVIDVVAADLDALLGALDGRVVETARGPVALRTVGAEVTATPMHPTERILHVLTDPNIAYLLFILGMVGLVAELYNPGMVVPGLVGGLSLVLALLAFGNLPLSWGGLVLVLAGLGLMIGELHVEGFGALGVAGMAAFLLGSLILYRPPGAVSSMQVSPWLLAVMAAAIGTLLFVVLRAVLQSRRARVRTGVHALRGRTGTATSELAQAGTVEIDRESWSARAVGSPIRRGEPVVVVNVKGVVLEVDRQAPSDRESSDAE
ncbi:NfeD family protein [Nannocystis pusilla]|uniref:Nodulation protein NfeD n=1 Tax=Nannocystis pusilla TaxID=889268 RepID=A0ABS7U525_9BACT|nr:nodulation protein NfeD [Nannocystis pusilla]MBZ5715663.1 nodulation protein NfeD [Nannocystis pusilla]